MSQIFLVIVSALGFAGGCALKGETVTAEQIGPENVQRLILDGAILAQDTPTPETSEVTPSSNKEPDSLQARLSQGLPPVEGHTLTDEEAAWVEEVKAGIIEVPFNADKIADLSIAKIDERIDGLGWTPKKGAKKAEAIDTLKEALVAYFADWDTSPAE